MEELWRSVPFQYTFLISNLWFKVQIFFGIVYYQRLRHMIADKFQVRFDGYKDEMVTV